MNRKTAIVGAAIRVFGFHSTSVDTIGWLVVKYRILGDGHHSEGKKASGSRLDVHFF